jgi:hypothetical protein
VNLTGAVDVPTVTNLDGDILAYTEGDGAQTLDQGTVAVIADVDSPDFNGGTLTVTVTGGTSFEDLTIGTGTVTLSAGMTSGSVVSVTGYGAIGTITSTGQDGANLVITFNSANATPAAVSTLAGAIQYTNSSDTPSGSRPVTFVVTDGDGGTSSTATVTVNLTAVNDAPVLSNLNGESSSQVVQGGGATAVSDMADITVSDVDSADFNGGTLTLSQGAGTTNGNWGLDGVNATSGGDGTLAAAETIAVGGISIGTVHAVNDGQGGNTLVITFNANATPALIQTLARAFTYDAPSGLGSRTFTASLNDGDGGSATSAATFSLSVTPAPPVVTNLAGDTTTVTPGNAAALDQGSNAQVTDGDSTNFNGGSLTVTRVNTGLAGTFALEGGAVQSGGDGSVSVGETVTVGGVAIGTVTTDGSGFGNLVIALNGNATPTLVGQLIQGVRYSATAVGSHAFDVAVTDAAGGATSVAARATVTVTELTPTPTPTPVVEEIPPASGDPATEPVVRVAHTGGVTFVTFEPRDGGRPVVFASAPQGFGAAGFGTTTVGNAFQSLGQGHSPLSQTFRAAAAQGAAGGFGGFGGVSAGFQAAIGDIRVLGALTRINALTGNTLIFQGGAWIQLDTLDALRLDNTGSVGPSASLDLGDGSHGIALADASEPEALRFEDHRQMAEADAYPAPRDFLTELHGDAPSRQAEVDALALALAAHTLPMEDLSPRADAA